MVKTAMVVTKLYGDGDVAIGHPLLTVEHKLVLECPRESGLLCEAATPQSGSDSNGVYYKPGWW